MSKHTAEVLRTSEGYRIDWVDTRRFVVYLGETQVNKFTTPELPRYRSDATEIAESWWHTGGKDDTQANAQEGLHDG